MFLFFPKVADNAIYWAVIKYYSKLAETLTSLGSARDRFIRGFGSLWGLYGAIYEVWEVYGDLMGVIGGRLYKVWEIYGDPMGA